MTGFRFSVNRCCCDSVVDCPQCSGTTPATLQAVVAGITANSGCPAGTCTGMNGTYTLVQEPSPCFWVFDPNPPGSGNCLLLGVQLQYVGAWTANITYYDSSGSLESINFAPDAAVPSDCTTWSSEQFSTIAATPTKDCEFGSATIQITAL